MGLVQRTLLARTTECLALGYMLVSGTREDGAAAAAVINMEEDPA